MKQRVGHKTRRVVLNIICSRTFVFCFFFFFSITQIENLNKQLSDLETTLSDFVPLQSKELNRMERRYATELESIEERVKGVMDKKNKLVRDFENELTRLDKLALGKQKELDELRKKDIIGDGGLVKF